MSECTVKTAPNNNNASVSVHSQREHTLLQTHSDACQSFFLYAEERKEKQSKLIVRYWFFFYLSLCVDPVLNLQKERIKLNYYSVLLQQKQGWACHSVCEHADELVSTKIKQISLSLLADRTQTMTSLLQLFPILFFNSLLSHITQELYRVSLTNSEYIAVPTLG